MKTMDYDTFTKLFNLGRRYDYFTEYIDSYRQLLDAEKSNVKIVKEFCDIMKNDFDIDISYLPYGMSTDIERETAMDNFKKWLSTNNIEVMEKPKRIWTQNEIKILVQTNDKMLYRSLQILYSFQTADEKSCKDTTEKNGKGFNSIDAEFLSSCAEFLSKKGFLTDRQKTIVRKKMIKYTNQLTKIANKA